MNKRLLVICGPTATGKTSFSIYLAKKFNGEILSADSRQIYKKMDIGTGKDITSGSIYIGTGSKLKGYYKIGGVRIWGYDLVDPKDTFSVSHYLKYAKGVTKDIWKREKLVILTGGTGLYVKSVIDGLDTGTVPRNTRLRIYLEKKNTNELYEILAQLDSLKAASLNASDKKNPRRLIRSIEIADAKLKGKIKEIKTPKPDSKLLVGLTMPIDDLTKKIDKRVKQRIKNGFSKEVKALLESGVNWDNQSMTSLGYRQWRDYIEEKKDIKEVIEKWTKEERKYAKRQITWFKKDKRIKWYDIGNPNWKKRLELDVRKWYKLRKNKIL